MDLNLKGKRALVTGSSGGIGFAVARGLAREQASVIVNGRSAQHVVAAVARIREELPEADVQGIAADLSSADGCARLVELAPSADVLVNNLGIYESRPFAEIRDDDWIRMFETNVMSGIRLTRHYLPQMLQRNWGRIIFVSSESGVQIPAEMIHYGVTKTAQVAVARGVAELTTGSGVTVNSVLPGPTRSDGVDQFIAEMAQQRGLSRAEVEEDFFRSVRPTSILQRFATPEETANLIVYLCSSAASATNGSALRVDGGAVRALL